MLSKWRENAANVQFLLKRLDAVNNNQLLTEGPRDSQSSSRNVQSRADDRLQLQRQTKDCSRAVSNCVERESDDPRHKMHVMHEPISSESDDRHPDPRTDNAQTASSSPDPQPLIRPKHPPSYNSLNRNVFQQLPHGLPFHSSPKKRTCQESVHLAPNHVSQGNTSTSNQSLRSMGKRVNSELQGDRSVVPDDESSGDQTLVVRSDVGDCCENKTPTNGSSSCWDMDLQEMRIREEYDRKKLEKDQLLVKASGLEAEIAVCRQKIQLLNHQIRGKTLLSLQSL